MYKLEYLVVDKIETKVKRFVYILCLCIIDTKLYGGLFGSFDVNPQCLQ